MKHLIDQSSKPWKMGTSYRWNCRKWRSNFCTRNSRIINFVNWTKMLHVQHFYFCTLHCAKDYLCNYIPTKISITVQQFHLMKLLSLMQLKNSKATERRVFFYFLDVGNLFALTRAWHAQLWSTWPWANSLLIYRFACYKAKFTDLMTNSSNYEQMANY